MRDDAYIESGVNIDVGEESVEMIRGLAERTRRAGVLGGIGGFSGLFKLGSGYKKPVIVSCTDGVGTKLQVALASGMQKGIGIDLVAMCVNDLITSGACPLFFLDYFSTNRLNKKILKSVIEGIVEGCCECGMGLLGGEIAEVRGFYKEEQGYDLAGFVVGVVEEEEIIDGSKIEEGDFVFGLESSGFHSNGYSLIRRILFEELGYGLEDWVSEFGLKVKDLLLKPTVLYEPLIRGLIREVCVKGMAHITGGGIEGNVSRIIPKGLRVDYYPRKAPRLFEWFQDLGGVKDEEMRRVFNLGVGMVVVVSSLDRGKVEGLGVFKELGKVVLWGV